MAEKDFTLGFGVDLSEFKEGLVEAKEAVVEAVDFMKESLATLQEQFIKVNEALIAFTAVLGGGKAFHEMVTETVNATVAAAGLSRQLGISTTQASILKVAMDETHVPMEAVSGAANRIAAAINKNPAEFQRLGVALRDSNGNLRNSFDIMLDVNEKLAELKEGTARNVEAQRIYGRGWQEIAPSIRITKKEMEEAKEKAEALHLIVGVEGAARTKNYRDAMAAVGTVMDALKKTVADALLPSLTNLGTWFANSGPAAVENFRNGIADLVYVWTIATAPVRTLENVVVTAFTVMKTAATGFGFVLGEVITGHLDDAKAVWKETTDAIANDVKTSAKEIEGYWTAASAAKKAAEDLLVKPETPTKEKPGADVADAGDTKVAVDNRRELLEKMYAEDAKYIDKMRETMEQGYKAEEEAFSKSAGARIAIAQREAELEAEAFGKDSPQYEAAQKHLVEVQRQAQEQLVQMANEFAKVQNEAAIRGLEEDDKILQEKYQKHEITNAKLLAGEIALEDQRVELARKAAQDQLANIDPLHDPVAYAAALAKIESLEEQHEEKITALRKQAAQRDLQVWDQLNKEIESGFTQNITKLVEGTETFRQAMRSLLKDVLNAVIQMLAQWVVQHTITMGLNVIQSKIAALAQVQSASGVAGANMLASFAGAPWPIDLTAPAAAASASGAALSFGALSAEEGYDIPSNVNPRVNLHQREMVLPRDIADPMRDSVKSGALSRGGGGGTMNLSVKALDGRSAHRVLTRKDTLKNAMREIHRRGVRG